MGKHIIFDEDLHRITLEDGEWVDILEKVPKFVRDECKRQTLKQTGEMGKAGKETILKTEIDSVAFNRVLLRLMIKGWSFTHSEKPIPVNEENINRMDEETSDLILSEIDKLNEVRGDESKKG